MTVDNVIGYTIYSGATNLKLADKEEMKLISKLHPCISQGYRKDTEMFDFNKDAGMYVCPAGHMAIRKSQEARSKEKKSPREIYFLMWQNAIYVPVVMDVTNRMPNIKPIK